MATPLSDEIRALITFANETTEAGDTKLGDCVKTLCEGYNGGKNLPSSPLVVPSGAISSRLAALLAYANETTGAGDTTMGDAIRTLCEGYGGGEPLPDGYTQLEYVSSGTAGFTGYLDTGIVPQISDTIKIKVFRRHVYAFWGADNFVTAVNGTDYWRVFNRGGTQKGTYVVNAWNEYIYQNGILTDSVRRWSQASAGIACTQPMYLFRRQSASQICNCDISYFLIKGKIELIPARRDADGVVGFYDKINKVFLPPTAGVLKAGPEIYD